MRYYLLKSCLVLFIGLISVTCTFQYDKYSTSLVQKSCWNWQTCPKECQCSDNTIRCYGVTEIPKGLLNCTKELYLTGYCEKGYGEKCLAHLKSDSFTGLRGLEKISLKNNKIETLPTGIFKGMTNLTQLDLSNNRMMLLHDIDWFDQTPSLKSLTLSYNYIRKLKSGLFKNITSLEFLDLRCNQLTCIPKYTFQGLKSLKEISLQNNNIRYISDTLFMEMSDTLQMIKMTNNSITTIAHRAFSGLQKLEEVDLNNNFLNCGCSTYKFVENMLSKNVYVDGTCNNSQNLLATITEEFACGTPSDCYNET